MEKRELNELYERMAEEVIEEEVELIDIRNSPVKIAYLESNACRKDGKEKHVLGCCEKVAGKNKWAIDYDFTITIYKPNIEGMSPAQVKILLFHELLHVGIDRTKAGGYSYYIKKHDLSDFRAVVDKYGTNWDAKPVDGELDLE